MSIKAPSFAFFGSQSFRLVPDGSLILPAQILDAYALAYADGYILNFLLAAALPLAHSLVMLFEPLSVI
jgi:hypothetical protein